MTDPTEPTPDPRDLDGHTIEELAEYVERGRTPADPTIDDSPACRSAMAALERLQSLSGALADSGPPDPSWTEQLFRRIAADSRPGPDFTLLTTRDGDEVVMTEGALRSLIRAAGDALPGTLVGRIRFRGDLSAPEQPLTVETDVVLAYGVPIGPTVDALRAAVADALDRHTRFVAPRIDVRVRDVMIQEEDE